MAKPSTEVPVGSAQPQENSGPRIVINPEVFSDNRDALCVALNEAFRVIMEELDFEPMTEPTPAQRRFFADTAYANDELMLKRTILARICTFDTSIGAPAPGDHTGHSESTAPTQEQLEEATEFLELVMQNGVPQNEEEQRMVQRIYDILVKTAESGVKSVEGAQPKAPTDTAGTTQGAVGGGVAGDEEPEQPTSPIMSPVNGDNEDVPTNADYQAGAPGLPNQLDATDEDV